MTKQPTSKQIAYHESRKRLTPEQIQEARALYYQDYTDTIQRPTIQALATRYNVAYNTMFRAVRTPTKPTPSTN